MWTLMWTQLLLLVVLAAIGVAVYLYVRGARRPAPKRPGGTPAPEDSDPSAELARVGPGDVIALWSGKEAVVERVVECQESLPTRVTRWKWVFLEGEQLLALTPVGNVLYTDTEVLHQGSAPYEQLTGEVERGGALKTFEARVRDRSIGANPVVFEHAGQRYQLQSTGAFSAPDQPLPEAEVWQDVQVDERQNVYFRLAAADGTQVLGIWTSHIALLIGRALAEADVRAVYRTGR